MSNTTIPDDVLVKLQELKCPNCEKVMLVRTKSLEHINKATGKLTKGKYYQYYCTDCDDENTGWTTTESDNKSEIFKSIKS